MKRYLQISALMLVAFNFILIFGCEEQAQIPPKLQESAIVDTKIDTAAQAESQPETQVLVEAKPKAEDAVEKPATPQIEPEPETKKIEMKPPVVTAKEPSEKTEETTIKRPRPKEIKKIPGPPDTERQAPSVEPQPEQPDASGVAVTVNGQKITEDDINARLEPTIKQMQAQNKGVSQDMVDSYKKHLRQKILDSLIIEKLLEKKIQEQGIEVTEEEIRNEVQNIAARNNMSVDDLKKDITQKANMTFEQWKEKAKLEKIVAFRKLMQPLLEKEVNITDEDAQKYYNDNQQRFNVPERVRASHILIKPEQFTKNDPNIDPNTAKQQAKIKAEEVLKQIKDGADFAELAKANSACPSSKGGGDLSFFPRGKMVKPFEEAAFTLQPGQISDVVETKFGYHIIKVTDRKDAKVTAFEEAKQDILKMLDQAKRSEVVDKYVESLRESANIVYPPGKEPPQPPSSERRRSAPRPPASKKEDVKTESPEQ